MDVDRGKFLREGLKDCPVVIDLHQFAPGGGRATNGRDGRRLERFAKMREDFPVRPWISFGANTPW